MPEHLVDPVSATLAAPFLFVLPGLVALALFRERTRSTLDLSERLFLMVAVSTAWTAWLSLLLAELGVFSVPRVAFAAGVALAGLAVAARRRLGWPLGGSIPGGWVAPLVVLALAVALQARPSEYVVGGRDPGAYVAAMAVIARTGTLAYVDPVVLSIPSQDVELFFPHAQMPAFSWRDVGSEQTLGEWSRFMGFDLDHPATGRVVPQFFHLFPAFGANLFAAMGTRGALATPPVFGVLGTLAVFFTLRRLFGTAPGLLGAVLLSLNVLQVWFARYPVSEPMSQFLLFLALFAFLLWEETGFAAWAALAGAALGATLLVRIDSVLVVAPLVLYLLLRRARGELPWRAAWPLLAPFTALAAHAAIHAVAFSSKYLNDVLNRRYWRLPPALWIGIALVVIACLMLARVVGPRLCERWGGRARLAATTAVWVVVVLALYAYFLRPWLSAWAGGDGNAATLESSRATWLRALGFHSLAAHDAQAFVRFGWFVTPPGLALAVAGLVVALRERQRRSLFPILLALSFALFYFYKIRVSNDYFFAMRRFVPAILPFATGFMALALVRFAAPGGWRRAGAGLAAASLATAFAIETGRVARYVDWKGAVRFVDDVARRFGPSDVVLFEPPGQNILHLLSLPLWAEHGVNALQLHRANPDPDRVRRVIEGWRGRYKNVYFVHSQRADLCGLFLERVSDFTFGTFEWVKTYDRPPRHPESRALRFTLSRFVEPTALQVPPLDEVDVGGSDDVLVSGLFDKERTADGERSYRWTGRCGSVFLPGAGPGATLLITASVERRPETSPAEVSVSFGGVPVGGFAAGQDWREYSIALPETSLAGARVLRIDVEPWRPANFDPASRDVRDLGVMIDRIRIVAPQSPGAPR